MCVLYISDTIFSLFLRSTSPWSCDHVQRGGWCSCISLPLCSFVCQCHPSTYHQYTRFHIITCFRVAETLSFRNPTRRPFLLLTSGGSCYQLVFCSRSYRQTLQGGRVRGSVLTIVAIVRLISATENRYNFFSVIKGRGHGGHRPVIPDGSDTVVSI